MEERDDGTQEEGVLDQTSEQMATLQRENHHGGITTLRLKPPLEDARPNAALKATALSV